jgi:hypothetical protein
MAVLGAKDMLARMTKAVSMLDLLYPRLDHTCPHLADASCSADNFPTIMRLIKLAVC